MAKIFAILTAVVLAIAAFLAYQNMGKSGESGRGYKGWISKRTAEQRSLRNKEGELQDRKDDLQETEGTLAEVNEDIKTLEGEVETQIEKNKQIFVEKEAKQSEAKAKAKEVAEKEGYINEFGDVEQVIGDLRQTRSELAEIEAQITTLEAQQGETESRLTTVGTSVDSLREQIDWRVSGRSNPNLSTRVRSAYPSLGFVTLAGGDNLGIVKNSPLEVVRSGEVIGKLIVTTVESTTSAADVIPGSVAEGRRVIAGDRVRVAQNQDAAANALN